MRSRNCVMFALGAVCALMLGGTAYAANGGSLLIGRSNLATAPTSLTNTAGTPLVLTAKAGSAPLKVNDHTRVGNLNADLLDGVDSSALALKAGRTGIVMGSTGDGDGFVNTARCPSGTFATGGGGYASDTRDSLYYSGPDINDDGSVVPNSWFAVAEGDTYAWVVCYNPRGAVAGAVTNVDGLPSKASAQVQGERKRMP